MNRIIRIAGSLVLLVYAVAAMADGKDELWEISSGGGPGGGMGMPQRATQQCIAKDSTYQPDKSQNKDCQTTDYQRSGNKVTWKMQCTGKAQMSGSGEMTRTADNMNGTMTMNFNGMSMTMTMVGKRVGTCDAAEQTQKREAQVQEIKSQAQAAQGQACDSMVKSDAETGGFGRQGADKYHGQSMCAASQPKLCSSARDFVSGYQGYAKYDKARKDAAASAAYLQKNGSDKSGMEWGWVLNECQIDLDHQLAPLCKRSIADRKYEFAMAYCPVEAKAMNDKYCGGFGMDYTADMSKPNAGMCTALRGAGQVAAQAPVGKVDSPAAAPPSDAQPNPSAAAPADKPKQDDSVASKATEAAKKLKGLLGF